MLAWKELKLDRVVFAKSKNDRLPAHLAMTSSTHSGQIGRRYPDTALDTLG